MKRIVALFLLIMTMSATTAFATEDLLISPAPEQKAIDVIVNGNPLALDVAPVIVNDRTMVPMRAIFEALGAKVTWIPEDRLIIATCDDKFVVLQIDNAFMTVEKTGQTEKESILLDAPPFILDDRTLVPARAVSEALDAEVKWDGTTRTVTVIKSKGNVSSGGTN